VGRSAKPDAVRQRPLSAPPMRKAGLAEPVEHKRRSVKLTVKVRNARAHQRLTRGYVGRCLPVIKVRTAAHPEAGTDGEVFLRYLHEHAQQRGWHSFVCVRVLCADNLPWMARHESADAALQAAGSERRRRRRASCQVGHESRLLFSERKNRRVSI
jgi:hypothetical protein